MEWRKGHETAPGKIERRLSSPSLEEIAVCPDRVWFQRSWLGRPAAFDGNGKGHRLEYPVFGQADFECSDP